MTEFSNRLRRIPIWITLFAASRITYFLTAYLWQKYQGNQYDVALFCQYDCKWYLRIIDYGYLETSKMPGHESASNWAFFPAFPIAIKIIATVLSANMIFTGLIVNLLLSLFSLYFLNKYTFSKSSNKVRFFTLFLFAFSPSNAYFNSLYTEALYSLLLIVTLHLVKEKKYILAGIAGSFLSVTRITGLIVCLLIYIYTLFDKKNYRVKLLGLFLVTPMPIFYFFYAYIGTGDFLMPIHAQKAWGVRFQNPFAWIDRAIDSNSITSWAYLFTIVISVFICVYFYRNKKFLDAIPLIPVIATSTFSTQINFRFFFAIYPIYLFISEITQHNVNARKIIALFSISGLILSSIFWITAQGFMV